MRSRLCLFGWGSAVAAAACASSPATLPEASAGAAAITSGAGGASPNGGGKSDTGGSKSDTGGSQSDTSGGKGDTGGSQNDTGGSKSDIGGSSGAGGGGTSNGGSKSSGGAGGSGGTSGSAGAISYSTTFDLTESPISENGAWKHVGVDWTLVNTSAGNAYGTQQGTGAYDDSYAYLSGFPPDQSASAVVRKDPAFATTSTREIEILLRWSDSAHDAHGYECNLAHDGAYAEIVRWNGALSSYTYVSGQGSGRSNAGVHDGDVFSAEIRGNIITTRLNGVTLNTADVSAIGGAVWKTGNPGIGFWKGGGASFAGDYGFKSYVATAITP